MAMPWVEKLKEDATPAVGWLIFIGLWVALLTDHYIADPFIFGFAYYVLFALTKSLGTDHSKLEYGAYGTINQRLLIVGIISLLYLWFAFQDDVQRRQFVRQFERTCYESSGPRTRESERICEEIQLKIDRYLFEPGDDSDE